MVCYVSKWVRVVFLLKFVVMCVGVFYLRSVSCPQWCVSKWVRVVYLRSVSCPQCVVSKWVRVVYLRSVSCPQWCVMLVSGSVLFIFVLCPVLNGVLC